MPSPCLHIGIDAGGTKTALSARLQGQESLFTLVGPAANLQRQGLTTTAEVLVSLITQTLMHHPQAVVGAVCAGVAGAGDTDDQDRLASAVTNRLTTAPAFPLVITHDGAIAFEAAFEGESGLMLIAGTGSILFARTRTGQDLRCGGWGYVLGDEGGGHQIGLHGLRAVAHAYDGGPPTQLRPLLKEHHGFSTRTQLIHGVYQDGWPLQQMAPLVIKAAEEGDTVARDILTSQTQALAAQARWLTQKHADINPRIAVLGGLTQSPTYKAALSKALSTALPGWSIQPPLHPPVRGALRLAEAAALTQRD